jgi:hypothetical protein
VKPGERTYPDIVRDLLTVMTGGTVAEVHAIGAEVPGLIHLDNRPVRRVSHLEGTIELGDERLPYRFTDRDFMLVGSEQNPDDLVAIRFRDRGRKPAPQSTLVVNYYPARLRPTPLTDVNVGSVARTLIETIARELATQYQQLQRVYDSAFVGTATGSALDNVVALVDVRRLAAGHPVGRVRFARRAGAPGAVFIPIATVVSDGEGNRYLTSAEATLLPNQASIEVWVHGERPSTEAVEAGALAVLERAIAGIDRVGNDEPTFRATEEESDAQLAARARRAVHAAGRGTLDAIRFGLESLPFVSAVSLSEHPDPLVPGPGMLRVDVALREDNERNRRQVDRRLLELRPAGIFVLRQWADKLSLSFRVDLRLAGAPRPAAATAGVRAGVVERLSDHARGLRPGDTLRRSRLIALVLQDPEVVDAQVSVTADGEPVAGDAWELPAGRAAALAALDPVTFGPMTFEEDDALGLMLVQVDLHLTVRDLAITEEALKARARAVVGPLVAGLVPGASLAFDQVATAIRDDEAFALERGETVVLLDQESAGFTELRDNDPPWTVPAGAALELRSVDVTVAQ